MTFNLFDIVMLAVILISVIIGYVRGAAGTIISFVGGIISVFISSVLGNNLAPWIYSNFFKESINEDITNAVADVIGNGMGNIGDGVINSLPTNIQEILYDTGIVNILNNVTGSSAGELASSSCDVVQNVIEPIYIGIIQVCVTVVLFVILSIIISVICNLSGLINKIPIVGTANKLVGCVLGAFYGIMIVMVAVLLMNVAIPFIDEDYTIRENISNQSFLFGVASDVTDKIIDTSAKALKDNNNSDSLNSENYNYEYEYYDDNSESDEYTDSDDSNTIDYESGDDYSSDDDSDYIYYSDDSDDDSAEYYENYVDDEYYSDDYSDDYSNDVEMEYSYE